MSPFSHNPTQPRSIAWPGPRLLAGAVRGLLGLPGPKSTLCSAPEVSDVVPEERARPTIHFSGLDHPLEMAKYMFSTVGAPRTGKSLTLKRMALSVLAAIRDGLAKRVFFFDFKREYEPWLRTFLPPDIVKVIQPFDPRGVAWDIAADIHNVDQAAAIGKLLAPTRPDAREPFFEDAVGVLMSGVMVSLHVAREGKWALGDVVEALQSHDSILQTLNLAPALNRFRIETFMKAKQMNRDVLATLGNRIQALDAVARRWERAGEALSLTSWMDGQSVLVLGHSHEHADATAAITQALIYRLSQLLLDGPDIDHPQSFVFIDELPSAGRLDNLEELLAKGPSRGVVAAVGFQDIGSLRHIYGPDRAQALNSFLGHKAFFRIADPYTAEWASLHFGEKKIIHQLVGRSWTSAQNSSSTLSINEHLDKERVVPPGKFLDIPALCPPTVNSLGSYVICPYLGKYRYELSLDAIRDIFPKDLPQLPPAGERAGGGRWLPESLSLLDDDLPYV